MRLVDMIELRCRSYMPMLCLIGQSVNQFARRYFRHRRVL